MIKQLALDIISELPDNVEMDEIIEALYLRMKIQKGLDDFENDKVITHEDLKKEISTW